MNPNSPENPSRNEKKIHELGPQGESFLVLEGENGELSPYGPMTTFSPEDIAQAVSLRLVSAMEGFHPDILVLTRRDGKTKTVTPTGMEGLSVNTQDSRASIVYASLEEELQGSGFQEMPDQPGYYTLRSMQGTLTNIIVKVEKGGIVNIWKNVIGSGVNFIKPGASYELSPNGNLVFHSPHTNVYIFSQEGGPPYSIMVKKDPVRPIELGDLTIRMPQAQDEGEGFSRWGTNESTVIESLTHLDGKGISQLEDKLRPGRSSLSGFIEENESLLSVLRHDNDLVLSLGVTHPQISACLKAILIAYQVEQELVANHSTKSAESHIPFVIGGHTFEVFHGDMFTRGAQGSPFSYGAFGGDPIITLDPETGRQMSVASLLPDMIALYGFYETTSYRMDPEAFILFIGADNIRKVSIQRE